jgi:putative ABC transport system substrate-binding protein
MSGGPASGPDTHHAARSAFMKQKPLLVISLLALLALGSYLWLRGGPPATAGPRVIATVQLTDVDNSTVAGFIDTMTNYGYRAGKDVIYLQPGPAGSIDRLDRVIERVLQDKPDLILVSSTPGTLAVKRLTVGLGIPVVFAPVNDPLDAGIVSNLQQPGGHITGIRLPTGDGLRLQWLTRIAPGVRRVYLPYTPTDKSSLASLQQAEAAAALLGLEIISAPLSGSAAGAPLAVPAGAEAIFLPRDSGIEARIADFVRIAVTRKLPLCAPSSTQVAAGALFSYGFVHRQIGAQAARLADQILRGTPAGSLPVEMAENYLAINLRTAGAIGLDIPNGILSQAEQLVRD